MAKSSFVFLSLSDEELIEDLGRYMSALLKQNPENPLFLNTALELKTAKKTEELVQHFVANSSALLFAPPKELEGAYNMLLFLVKKSKKELFQTHIKTITGFFLTDLELPGKPNYYLNALGNIYYHVEAKSPIRYDVYMVILEFAAKHHRLHTILPTVQNVDDWLEEWGVTPAQKRDLYKLLRNSLNASGQHTDSHTFLLKLLKTYENSSAQELASVKDLATAAIVESIRIKTIFQVDDLLRLKAIEQLKSELIYQLLEIFAHQGYKEYMDLYNAQKENIEKIGLSHDDNVFKLRLITLATLAATQEEIPYSTFASSLLVPETEVEKWVLDAIRFKLIEAKIDQLKSVVLISKTTYRVFGDSQWRLLKIKLEAWKLRTTEVLQVIQNAKVAAQSLSAKSHA